MLKSLPVTGMREWFHLEPGCLECRRSPAKKKLNTEDFAELTTGPKS